MRDARHSGDARGTRSCSGHRRAHRSRKSASERTSSPGRLRSWSPRRLSIPIARPGAVVLPGRFVWLDSSPSPAAPAPVLSGRRTRPRDACRPCSARHESTSGLPTSVIPPVRHLPRTLIVSLDVTNTRSVRLEKNKPQRPLRVPQTRPRWGRWDHRDQVCATERDSENKEGRDQQAPRRPPLQRGRVRLRCARKPVPLELKRKSWATARCAFSQIASRSLRRH